MDPTLAFNCLYLMVVIAAGLGSHDVYRVNYAPGCGSRLPHRTLHTRDAYTLQEGPNNNEGEVVKPFTTVHAIELSWLTYITQAHNMILAPNGSEFISIPVQKGSSEEVAVFWTSGATSTDITHVYVIIHGRFRDGSVYWVILNDAIKQSRRERIPGADAKSIVVAPQFFSEKYNSGQYSSKQLVWGDVNAWQAGEQATRPTGTILTSIDALDAILAEFSDRNKYPKITNVTVVGHGGGGQLAQRYAALAAPAPCHIHIRYIHADPSSCAYFTDDRPATVSGSSPSKQSCELYNTWRYGFDNFSGTTDGLKSPKEYFRQYISRDVISLVGLRDTDEKGDQTCMARIQGGVERRDRNLIWYRYINELARTNESLKNLPGKFISLPDWSDISGNKIGLRLAKVANATHNATDVFESSTGRAALFSSGGIETECC